MRATGRQHAGDATFASSAVEIMRGNEISLPHELANYLLLIE